MFTSLNQRLASALLILTATSTALHADTLKVKKGGLYPTIQSAVNAANSGDTILVSGGTYLEEVSINMKTNLTLKAKKGAKVTVTGQGGNAPLSIVNSPSTTLHGICVSNTPTTLGLWVFQSDGFTMKQCEVMNIPDSHGILVVACDNVQIKNSTFQNIGFDAIICATATGLKIQNCKVLNAGGIGINFHGKNGMVSKCEISNCPTGIYASGKNHTISKNRIKFTSDGMKLGNSMGQFAEDCLIVENTVSNSGIGIVSDYIKGGAILKNTLKNNVHGLVLTYFNGYFNAQVTVDQNVIRDGLGLGVSLDLAGCTVTRNKVSGYAVGLVADVHCTSLFEKNTFSKNQQYGAVVQDEFNLFIKNKFSGNSGIGLADTGEENTYEKNQFSGNGIDGLQVDGKNSTFTSNKANGNGQHGFIVNGTNNKFVMNSGKKNGIFDMVDFNQSMNVYAGNVFPNEK